MKERIILHSDANAFYASVEELYHPELRGQPLAVAGDPENRHGIILAKSQIAKEHGVKTGEAIWEAKQKCPHLVILQPNYPLYQKFSRMARNIYYSYSDKVESFGLDECWIDITDTAHLFGGSGKKIAEEIRQRIKFELGITVSIGVSWNKIFSKFGSDFRKPDAVTVITHDNYKDIIWPQDVGDLLYVGPATAKKLKNWGIDTVGKLACTSVKELKYSLGKMGEIIWLFANGHDYSAVKTFEPDLLDNAREIDSIGNSQTTPRDLVNLDDVKQLMYTLTESVAMRMREAGFFCNTVAIHVRDMHLQSFSRQKKLEKPTDITKEIVQTALNLFQNNYNFENNPAIRSIGVRVMSLVPNTTPIQIDFFTNEEKRIKQHKLDTTIDWLRGRYGNNAVRRAVTLGDKQISQLDPKKDNVIHPVGYFN